MYGVYVVIEAIIASTVTIIGVLGSSLYWLGRKFAQINERFRQIDERFRQINKRFQQVDERFQQIDERFKHIDMRFEEMKKYIDEKFTETREYVNERIKRLGDVFVNYQEFFVEYLASEGILKEGQKELLRNEARRLFKLGLANPVTKEELRRAKELLEKDELSLEEALELRELARKIAWEYGTPEAWKLHIYASMMVGLAMRRKAKRRE
ncbi:MAG: hypothetical protein DRN15_08605 [Thermoprotei archaeon]|nr:MAG: hypothetical protein DRN15_08605 [Thermoprotei archaeon]RLF22767.1 MAG: hypothetical protein DRM97_05405 [Thermoprotei archaeon]